MGERKTRSRAEVVVTNGGYAVSHPDHRGKELYVGIDGYWSKILQGVNPFKTKEAAQEVAYDLNDPRSSRWE